ncbi:hypothetical protein F4679DRAFT_581291 [Xylaria curta]|nr:hypothetical protein F4679DRAFT_581291 [Xylaria curta]
MSIPEHHSSSDLQDGELATPSYRCVTQMPSGGDAVYVGFPNTATRWSNDLTFIIDRASFLLYIRSEYIEACVLDAIKSWNGAGVHIRQAQPDECATFVIAYRYEHNTENDLENGITLARSFFPFSPPQGRVLFVYEPCFWQMYYPFMSNVLSHEIGHILGLRHEFLEDPRSMLIGCPNPHSVMNYYQDLSMMTVTAEDVNGVRDFYSREDKVENWQIVTVSPQGVYYISHQLCSYDVGYSLYPWLHISSLE